MVKTNAKKDSAKNTRTAKAVSKDERFAKIGNDPRFKLPKKQQLRSDLDSRFKKAFKEEKEFHTKTVVDKYGRKVDKGGDKKDLEKYYNLETSGSESESEEDEDEDKAAGNEDDSEDGSEPEEKIIKSLNLIDRARGEGASDIESSSSDSDSDSDSESEIEEEEELLINSGEADEIPLGDETASFACVNMDWDNLRAVDLMATFSSFAPSSGTVLSVSIYPSEYGKQMMAKEEFSGPAAELFEEHKNNKKKEKEINEKTIVEEDLGEEIDSKKFRKYQLQRLKYYYAIVKCDSIRTAKSIFDNCDGTEFESTANFFDLRYVPDDVEFDDEPKDFCDKIPANFKPNSFVTGALQHSKVKLTWDETPSERVKLSSKAFSQKDIDEMDYKAYLASDSESEDNAQEAAEKYKQLLGGFTSKKNDDEEVDMEITFTPGMEDGATEKKEDQDETTIEKYRRKEKERRKKRMEKMKKLKDEESSEAPSKEQQNAEMELLLMDDDLTAKPKTSNKEESTDNGKSSKKNRRKTKTRERRDKQEEVEADFDVTDDRFKALFENPDYAIDTTLPQFKKTKGMEKIMDERRRRNQKGGAYSAPDEQAKKKRKVESNNHSEPNVNSLVAKLKSRNSSKK